MSSIGVKGIDVSGYNPGTNWTEVKSSGVAFAFIKCTEGVTYLNPHFKNDWVASKASGVIRGAYHFFHPKDDPAQQAEWFLNSMGPLTLGDLPPVLDWETHETTVAEEVINAFRWVQIVEKATGKKPIIYANRFYIDSLGNPPEFAQYPLWLADYEKTPTVPAPWSGYTFWQYTAGGVVPGVAAKCDLSLSGGDLAWLTEFSNQTT